MGDWMEDLCEILNHSSPFENDSEWDANMTGWLANLTECDGNETNGSLVSYKFSNKEYASIIIYILFSSLAVIGNTAVLRLLYKRGCRRTVFDITVGSLVIADLCTAIGFLSSNITFITTMKTATVSEGVEKFFNIFFEFTIFCFVVSILHVILITTERLYALFSPLKYRQIATKNRAKVPIIITWIASLAGSLAHAFAFKADQSDKAIGLMIIVSSGVLCLLYGIIAIKIIFLKRKSMFKSRKDHLVLMNSLVVTVSFLACLLPLAIGLLGANKNNGSTYLLSSFVAIKLLLDPILYFYVSFWKGRRETRRRVRFFTIAALASNTFIESNSNGTGISTIDLAARSNSIGCQDQKQALAALSKNKDFRRYTKTMSKIYN